MRAAGPLLAVVILGALALCVGACGGEPAFEDQSMRDQVKILADALAQCQQETGKPVNVPLMIGAGAADPENHRNTKPNPFLDNRHVNPVLKEKVEQWLGLKPGLIVADVGCGGGLNTFWMAQAVGRTGIVYAVDIQPVALMKVHERMAEPNAAPNRNIVPVLNQLSDVQLPPDSVDGMLLSDIHLQNNPEIDQVTREMLESCFRATKPGGKVMLIEHPVPELPTNMETVQKHWIAAGFAVVQAEQGQGEQPILVLLKKPEKN
jgi:ubiquinone/menaquinone biosynthesis C-methylase UbiE